MDSKYIILTAALGVASLVGCKSNDMVFNDNSPIVYLGENRHKNLIPKSEYNALASKSEKKAYEAEIAKDTVEKVVDSEPIKKTKETLENITDEAVKVVAETGEDVSDSVSDTYSSAKETIEPKPLEEIKDEVNNAYSTVTADYTSEVGMGLGAILAAGLSALGLYKFKKRKS